MILWDLSAAGPGGTENSVNKYLIYVVPPSGVRVTLETQFYQVIMLFKHLTTSHHNVKTAPNSTQTCGLTVSLTQARIAIVSIHCTNVMYSQQPQTLQACSRLQHPADLFSSWLGPFPHPSSLLKCDLFLVRRKKSMGRKGQ